MFNLNIPPTSLLGVEGSGGLCSKPNTPEILNSLIAMTNPLDNYNFANSFNNSNNHNNNMPLVTTTAAASVTVRNLNANTQNTSQDSSHSSSSSTPLDSPAGATNATMPSVQQTCSQLIKAGLKLTIQSKRKLSTCDSSSGSEQPASKCSRANEEFEETTDDDSDLKVTLPKGLTPEDEDRRRRRRERNKIAATKCRMKKRERTQNLIKEAEQLDTQNVDLKSQVRTLENERRKLLDMLQAHQPACIHHEGLNLPSKLLQSPAYKYLADLNLDEHSCNVSINGLNSPTNNNNTSTNASSQTQRTVIPPMSTIKFSRSNDFKAAAAVSAALSNPVSIVPQLNNLTQNAALNHHANHLPNGYCKPSPTAQELGYLNSPSQDSTGMCIAALQTPSHLSTTTTPTAHQTTVISNSVSSLLGHSMSDYIPNCDSSALGLSLAHTTPTTCTTPIGSNGGDSSVLLASVANPMSCASTPTTASDFVKNELVDSQSPYTTAQSAERFLFESNCDSFVDIKHAVNVHQPISHSHGGPTLLQNSNLGSSILDYPSSLMGSNGSGIISFHDQISIKNDYLNEADLLAQLTGEAADFVDLDTGVAAAFMANGGCLA